MPQGPAPTGTFVEAPGFGRVLVERPASPVAIAVAVGASPADLPDDVVVLAVDHTAWIRRGGAAACWAPGAELRALVESARGQLDLPDLPVLFAGRGEGTHIGLAILATDPAVVDRAALSGFCPPAQPTWALCAAPVVPWEALAASDAVAIARPCAAVRDGLQALGVPADDDLPAAVLRVQAAARSLRR